MKAEEEEAETCRAGDVDAGSDDDCSPDGYAHGEGVEVLKSRATQLYSVRHFTRPTHKHVLTQMPTVLPTNSAGT